MRGGRRGLPRTQVARLFLIPQPAAEEVNGKEDKEHNVRRRNAHDVNLSQIIVHVSLIVNPAKLQSGKRISWEFQLPERFAELTGFILAGGRSRRMGRPKQDLELGGQRLLDRAVRLLENVCGRVAILGAVSPETFRLEPLRAAVEYYEDIRPGHGPLGGIYSGLKQTRTEYNLFLGCDMPLVTAALLRFVVSRALDRYADVTVCCSAEGRIQRLAGVYRRRARAVVRAAVDRNLDKVSAIYPRISCEVIGWSELARARFPASVFTNINTPEDYLAVRRMFEE